MNLWNNAKYRGFTRDRNNALEHILGNALYALTDIIMRGKRDVLFEMSLRMDAMRRTEVPMARKMIQNDIMGAAKQKLYALIPFILKEIARLHRHSEILTQASEGAVLSMLTEKPQGSVKSAGRMPFHDNAPIMGVIEMSLNKILRKLEDQIEFMRIYGEFDDWQDRVNKAFPKPKAMARPRRRLQKPRKIAEADYPNKRQFHGFVDDDEWQDLVKNYQTRYAPSFISAADIGLSKDEFADAFGIADWELERNISELFVSAVRDGQVQAAKDMGAKDFVWIAILDDRTCQDCCAKRDGMTVSEIEAKLKGPWKDDECQATVPKAHDNCRCEIGPILDDDEVQGIDVKEFEEWLLS